MNELCYDNHKIKLVGYTSSITPGAAFLFDKIIYIINFKVIHLVCGSNFSVFLIYEILIKLTFFNRLYIYDLIFIYNNWIQVKYEIKRYSTWEKIFGLQITHSDFKSRLFVWDRVQNRDSDPSINELFFRHFAQAHLLTTRK